MLLFHQPGLHCSFAETTLTNCQHSLHRQTLLLVGSHAALPPFETLFPHSYALLTASLVLGHDLDTCSQDITGPLSAPLIPLTIFNSPRMVAKSYTTKINGLNYNIRKKLTTTVCVQFVQKLSRSRYKFVTYLLVKHCLQMLSRLLQGI